jgi:hypothetical protein
MSELRLERCHLVHVRSVRVNHRRDRAGAVYRDYCSDAHRANPHRITLSRAGVFSQARAQLYAVVFSKQFGDPVDEHADLAR